MKVPRAQLASKVLYKYLQLNSNTHFYLETKNFRFGIFVFPLEATQFSCLGTPYGRGGREGEGRGGGGGGRGGGGGGGEDGNCGGGDDGNYGGEEGECNIVFLFQTLLFSVFFFVLGAPNERHESTARPTGFQGII